MKYVQLLVVPLSLLAGIAFADASVKATEDAPMNATTANQAPIADEFARLDVDKDGVLSRAELAHHPKAAHMAMVDASQDGVLSREEFDELQEM